MSSLLSDGDFCSSSCRRIYYSIPRPVSPPPAASPLLIPTPVQAPISVSRPIPSIPRPVSPPPAASPLLIPTPVQAPISVSRPIPSVPAPGSVQAPISVSRPMPSVPAPGSVQAPISVSRPVSAPSLEMEQIRQRLIENVNKMADIEKKMQEHHSPQSNNGQITVGILMGVGVITLLAVLIGIETTIMIGIGLSGIVITIGLNN